MSGDSNSHFTEGLEADTFTHAEEISEEASRKDIGNLKIIIIRIRYNKQN
jgi:hypothetical protein